MFELKDILLSPVWLKVTGTLTENERQNEAYKDVKPWPLSMF